MVSPFFFSSIFSPIFRIILPESNKKNIRSGAGGHMAFIVVTIIAILLLLILMIHIQLESNRVESEIGELARRINEHYENQ